MIDFLGVAIGTLFLFAAAGVGSLILGLIVWLATRRGRPGRRLTLIFATMLPLGAAAWWWLGAALLPGLSLFGDISEPLPHGFRLTALGKMPDYGQIDLNGHMWKGVELPNCAIEQIGLAGDMVAGKCNHGWAAAPDLPPEAAYFLFDTKSCTTRMFSSRADMERTLGAPVVLTDNALFHSPYAKKQDRFNRMILSGPAFVGLLALIALVLWQRTRPASSS